MAAALVLGFLTASTSQAQVAQLERGRAFAQTYCASCHAIGRSGESSSLTAVSFRSLHLRYPVEDLAESLVEGIMTGSLAEGIVAGHRAVPRFKDLDGSQSLDLLAYLKSLEP
jgi:cytochrome c